MQSGASGAASVRVAAAALHLAARVAVSARAEAGGGRRVGQLEVLLDVVHEAVDDVAVPEEGLVVLLLRRRVVTVAATILLLISLRRHDRAQGEHSGG